MIHYTHKKMPKLARPVAAGFLICEPCYTALRPEQQAQYTLCTSETCNTVGGCDACPREEDE